MVNMERDRPAPNANREPVTVTPIARPVQAMRWDGRYHSAEAIACALNGRVIVWPVPEGYEHHLRTEGEQDRSRGDTLDTAPAFLVVRMSGTDHAPTRVGRGWWFVWDDDHVELMDADEFDARYEYEQS